MTGVVNTGSFSKSLWPGVNKWYGDAYNEHKVEYTDLFDTSSSRMRYEEDVSVSGFGLASVKPEAESISYDSEKQGFVTRYSHVVYGLGFIVTREAFEDDLYDVVGKRKARGLAFSMRQTKEIVAANVYNRAFNTSYVGGDGKALAVNDHPNIAGGTWSNVPSVASDLSEASLEQACIDIGKWTNDRGLRIAIMPKKLIIPIDLEFEAYRILKTQYRVGTADNDINVLNMQGKFPGGICLNHYLSDSDAWFIRTNAMDGMKHFVRRGPQFAPDNDFDTENAKFKATERYSFGWTDPRGIYASEGA